MLEETQMWRAIRREATIRVAVASLGLIGIVVLAKGLETSECAPYRSPLIWAFRSMRWVAT
jgi:hypothetical protein